MKSIIKSLSWKIARFPISYKIYQASRMVTQKRISAVIFSKDRVMQLHALLESFFSTKIGECKIIVIYAASSNDHQKAYSEVEILYKDRVVFVNQNNFSSFKNCLVDVIASIHSGKIFFLVDDIIFTEEVDYQGLASLNLHNIIFSLRMGQNLTYSYVVSREQPLPTFLVDEDGNLKWNWVDAILDWRYPLSVDGHIFNAAEVFLWAKHLDYISPSSFESAMQLLLFIYRNKSGMCFKKSRIVNIPANKVQNEVANLHGEIHQDDLLHLWNKGFMINYQKLRGWKNNSVHQMCDFEFIPRK